MANVNVYSVYEKMHKMRAKLYPNYLPKGEGTYIARTANESSVSVEDICAAMKNRGGYDGSYEDAVQTIRHFLKETEYQLADGFSVNTGLFTIHPNIGGVFESDKETHDHIKHPVTFRFQSLKPLRDLRESIEVIIEGIADTSGYIAEFTDVEAEANNTIFVPGDQFVLIGHKIKNAGDDPSCGVYLVPVDDPSKAIKITRIAENTQNKIIGVLPPTGTGSLVNRIEVRTQFSGSGSTFLKAPRIITSSFTLEEA
jgi:hypothetical protein